MPLSKADKEWIREELRRAMRPRLMTVEDICREEQITRKTARKYAKERGVPQRTIGGDLRTSDNEPLRYSRLEWERGKETNTRTVKNHVNG